MRLDTAERARDSGPSIQLPAVQLEHPKELQTRPDEWLPNRQSLLKFTCSPQRPSRPRAARPCTVVNASQNDSALRQPLFPSPQECPCSIRRSNAPVPTPCRVAGNPGPEQSVKRPGRCGKRHSISRSSSVRQLRHTLMLPIILSPNCIDTEMTQAS